MRKRPVQTSLEFLVALLCAQWQGHGSGVGASSSCRKVDCMFGLSFLRRMRRLLNTSIAHPAWKAVWLYPEHDPSLSLLVCHTPARYVVEEKTAQRRRVIPITWLRLRCLIVVLSLIRWKLRWFAGMLIVLDHSGNSHCAQKDHLRGIGIYGNRTVRMKASGIIIGAVDLWSGNRLRCAHAAEATKPITLSWLCIIGCSSGQWHSHDLVCAHHTETIVTNSQAYLSTDRGWVSFGLLY